MPTHIVKYNDDTNELTAYCEDDKTKTEIGPAKWNPATNRLEVHCNGEEFPVKWNYTENRLEARNVAAGCCEEIEYSPYDCSGCFAAGATPKYASITFSDVSDCGDSWCDWVDGTHILEHQYFGTVCQWGMQYFYPSRYVRIKIAGSAMRIAASHERTTATGCFYGTVALCEISGTTANNNVTCGSYIDGINGIATWSIP